MISKKLILRLLTVFIFADVSSGKRCYAPVVCDDDQHTKPTWIEVSTPCQSESNKLGSQSGNTSAQKGEEEEMGVNADSNVTALKKEIEAQKTANDVINATIYDQQRVIKSLNKSVEFLKEEIEAQKTANDVINATIYDQQRVIKSLNKNVEFLKEENQKEKSERAKVKAEVAELKSENAKMNETLTKQMSDFEAKLNKLQEAGRKNEKEISDIQAAISDNRENSVTTPPDEKSTQANFVTTADKEVPSMTTLKTSVAMETTDATTEADYVTTSSSTLLVPLTTSQIETTPGYGCKDGEIDYGGYCFWFDVTRRDFVASESYCKGRNSTVGYIFDKKHYEIMTTQLCAAIPSGYNWFWFWLGLQQDPSNGNITVIQNRQINPFLQWGIGEPSLRSTETNIYLEVEKDASGVWNWNGMFDVRPSRSYGVICQYKSL